MNKESVEKMNFQAGKREHQQQKSDTGPMFFEVRNKGGRSRVGKRLLDIGGKN